MLAEKTMDAPHTEASHKSTFFRQSGWMMMATMLSGVFAAAVHIFSKKIPQEEYSAMTALIQLLNWMTIPGLGLQMVFALQTSSTVTDEQRHHLVGTFKAVLRWTFGLWLAMALVVFLCRGQLLASLKLSNPASLWFTVVAALLMLWIPIFQGLLQGRQNFLWLGWVQAFNGVGRFFIAAAIVVFLGGWTAGIMFGFVVGMTWALSTAVWQNADLCRESGAPFDARGWLRQVLPLTMGFGASQFIFSADALVVHAHLSGSDGRLDAPYMFGGTLARAIVLFTGPLAAVMFPKLAHSKARDQKHSVNLFGLTLAGTAVLACMAAIGITLTCPLLVKLGSRAEFAPTIVSLIAWFTWALVPLAVGNVLLNNLMAHSRFKVCIPLVCIAGGYWIALQYYHDSFKTVIQVLGITNLVFLAVCALFTWGPGQGGADSGKLELPT